MARKTPGKIRNSTVFQRGTSSRNVTIPVKLYVQRRATEKRSHYPSRVKASYEALACVASRGGGKRWTGDNCGRFATGRTPTSAGAKALKSLAITLATRSRARRPRR